MNVLEQIKQQVEEQPRHIALEWGEQQLTYQELAQLIQTVQKAIPIEDQRVGVWCPRCPQSFICALGVVFSAKTYVPLNPNIPSKRLLNIIEQADLSSLLIPSENIEQLLDVPLDCSRLITLFFFDQWALEQVKEKFPHVSARLLSGPSNKILLPPPSKNFNAYLLFTSGSTGEPKGIEVSLNNLDAYVAGIKSILQVTSADRCSQTFEMSFDLSIHDLFITLSSGATLVLMQTEDLYFPAHYIIKNRISIWFSVPTLAGVVKNIGQLAPNLFPSLRLSLFCGEALTLELAKAWSDAQNQQPIYNLYGPTEATIAFTYHLYDPNKDLPSLVPLGRPLLNQEVLIVDEQGKVGSKGELWLKGSQVVDGYYNNPSKTAEQFIENNQGRWYRTGDLVSMDSDEILHFEGRIDSQIKLHGHRIELFEIEAVFRKVTSIEHCYCFPKKIGHEVTGLIICIQGDADRELQAQWMVEINKTLPKYMVPEDIIFFRDLPVNASGKVDRQKIMKGALLNAEAPAEK